MSKFDVRAGELARKLGLIPGVVKIVAVEDRLEVNYVDGTTAVVARSPLARYSSTESFDVHLPDIRDDAMVRHSVVLSQKPSEVLELLGHLAASAVNR